MNLATGMFPEEISGTVVGSTATHETPVAIPNLAGGMVPEENSGRVTLSAPFETPPAIPSTHAEGPPDIILTDNRAAVANVRLGLVQRFLDLRQEFHSDCEAIEAMKRGGAKVARATLLRWVDEFQAHGYAGLVPRHHLCGPVSEAEKLMKRVGEAEFQDLVLKVRAKTHDMKSSVMGLRVHAKLSDSPPELLELIDYTRKGTRRVSKHALPPSIRDLIRLDPMIAKAHRGKRAQLGTGKYTRRIMDILPGDVWTADDTTPIWGWWVPWEHALGNPNFPKDSCEYRFGVKLLQGQLLALMDVASNCLISADLVARETSAYRAADIWALFGKTFAQYGLPRLGFHLERGSWDSNLIQGQLVEFEEGEVTLARRVGGLRMLPTNITPWHLQKHAQEALPKQLQTWTAYYAKSKAIEAFFDRSQTLEGMIAGNLGRDQMRRPNEKAKKQFEACRRGAADPRLHFLSGMEISRRLREIWGFLNSEPMEGEVFSGVPQVKWDNALREFPLYRMPEASEHLYRRTWHVARITDGMLLVKRKEWDGETRTHQYDHPELFARLEGRKVIAYYDEREPQSAAQLHCAESREYLGTADYLPPVGSYLDPSSHGHEARKRYNAAVSTIHMNIARHAPSRTLPPEIAQRRAEARAAAAEQGDGTAPATALPVSSTDADGTISTRQIPAAPKRRDNPFSPMSPDEYARKAERNAQRRARQALVDPVELS